MSTTRMLRPAGPAAAGRPRPVAGAVRPPRPLADRRLGRLVAGRRRVRRGPARVSGVAGASTSLSPTSSLPQTWLPAPTSPVPTRTTRHAPEHVVRTCAAAGGAVPSAPAHVPETQSRPAPATAMRLTRRGRLLCVALVVGLAVSVLSLGSASLAGTGAAADPVTYRTITIEAGQSLWEIAATAAPEVDPRTTVASIVELNDLPSGGAVRAGQQLVIPYAG